MTLVVNLKTIYENKVAKVAILWQTTLTNMTSHLYLATDLLFISLIHCLSV